MKGRGVRRGGKGPSPFPEDDPVEGIAGRMIAYVHGDLAGQSMLMPLGGPCGCAQGNSLIGQINMTIRTWRLPCIRARAIRDRRHRRPQSV